MQSFQAITVDQIATRAGLHRSAFMKRFGSKKEALFALHGRFCHLVFDEIASLGASIQDWKTLEEACFQTSTRLEQLQITHFAANRAMNELFMENLKVDPLTKEIWLATVTLMQTFRRHHGLDQPDAVIGAFAATQMLTSLNYNYVLLAMPGLPRDAQVRHQLIARCMVTALHIVDPAPASA